MRGYMRVAAAVVAGFGLALAASDAAVVADPGKVALPHGTILFAADNAAGVPELETVDAAGGQPRPLRGERFHGATPAYSPDGRYIAFSRWLSTGETRDARYGWDLVVARSDGSGAKVVVPQTDDLPFPSSPSWSLDGRWLRFDNPGPYDPGSRHIVGAGGGTPRTLRTKDLALWSPTRADIAAETRTGVAWMRLGRTRPELVIPGAESPVWSPRRAEFAYSKGQDLYVFDTRTRTSRLVAGIGACPDSSGGYAWSPDGQWITYVGCSTKAHTRSLFILARNGTGKRLLLRQYLGGRPSWRS